MEPRNRRRLSREALRLAALLVASCWAGVGPGAQPVMSGDDRPIQIQADSGIEWQQNAKVYVARGNAVATRADVEVHADVLIAHYREAKTGGSPENSPTGNTEIYRVDAEGNVVLKRNGQVLTGDRAVYDVDQGVGVVTGKALKLTTANETVTARDSFDWYDQRQIAVARGDAVATRNGKTVRADILTGYMDRTTPTGAKPGAGAKPTAAGAKPGGDIGPDPNSKLSRIDAQGHVVVTNGQEVGKGDYGVYNAQTGIVTLIGHVVLTRDKNVLTGQSAVMDLNTNVSRIMPTVAGEPGKSQRVNGLFVRRDGAEPNGEPNGKGTKK